MSSYEETLNADMRVTCRIRCTSGDSLRRAREVAENRIRPDEEITKVFRTFPGGKEHRETRTFRIGDFFDKIEIVEEDRPLSFKVVFCVSPAVHDPYWKDLLTTVLRSIHDSVPEASVRPIVSPK